MFLYTDKSTEGFYSTIRTIRLFQLRHFSGLKAHLSLNRQPPSQEARSFHKDRQPSIRVPVDLLSVPF